MCACVCVCLLSSLCVVRGADVSGHFRVIFQLFWHIFGIFQAILGHFGCFEANFCLLWSIIVHFLLILGLFWG